MKKLFTSFLLLILLNANAQSPTFEWAKNFASYNSEAVSNVIDASGNTYTAGKFEGTGDFDSSANTFNLTSINQFDLYVTKYDSNGNYIWAKSFGSALPTDTPVKLALDASGNVYLTGSFRGTSDFNPSSVVANLTSVIFSNFNYNSTFILKLDANGNYVWAKNILGGGGNQGASIKIDNNGDVVIGGNCTAFTDLDPGTGTAIISSSGNYNYILKLNAEGNYIWSKNWKGSGSTITYDMAVDTNNAIIATGIFRATMDFDPSANTFNLTSNNANDIFITKLDSNGNFIWAKSIGGADNDIVNAMTSDSNNNICLTGNFWGSVDFDTSSTTFNLVATSATGGISKDGFILKLDTNGDFVWAKKIGAVNGIEEDSTAIAVDNSGNVYTTGYLQDANLLGNDFDPGTGVFTLFSTNPGDAYYLKLDANGNFVWAFNYRNTSDSGRRQTKTLNIGTSGIVYSTGSFGCPNSNAGNDFDFSSGTTFLSCSSRSFLLKFNQTSLGILKNVLAKILLYPNPATNILNINFQNDVDNATLKIISITGQTVLEQKNLNGAEFNIATASLNAGLYLLQVSDAANNFTTKFIKQ